MSFYSEPLIEYESEYKPVEPILDKCLICTEEKYLVSMNVCDHHFCESCIISYLELKVSEADVRQIGCPSCTIELTHDFLMTNMTQTTIAKYNHFLEVKRAEENVYVKWCPKPNCTGYDVASPNNYKLKCSLCGHQYCYKCSMPWHTSKCKIKKDVTFELWAMANNVKICPRCKNHVQKNGGCPHMYCPRCNHRWCWICGGDYSSPSHNAFTCMMGRNFLDLYWGVIVLMLFFPILIPFGFTVLVIWFYETEAVEKDRMNGILSCFKSRFVAYTLAFIFSPALEAIAIVVAHFAIAYAIASKNMYNVTWIELIFRLIIGTMICGILSVAFFATLVLMTVVLPVAGCFFTVTKFYFIFTRCFKPKSSFEYPRLFG
jgi:IBR domain, a half RING-finger domain